MNRSEKSISTLVLVVLALVASALYFLRFLHTEASPNQVVHAEVSSHRVLDKFYGKRDDMHNCWFAVDAEDNQRYCMKIDRADKVSTPTEQRLYVLATGIAVNDEGKPDGAHVSSGLVGAFVIEDRNGQMEIVAANPKIPIGASGSAPTNWKFHQFGPADYWGWLNTTWDCHQGYCGGRYSILAPYGKSIRDLAGFAAYYTDIGAVGDNGTIIDSKLEIDSSKIDSKVFPLLIAVTGIDKEKELQSKTWTIRFNPKKWSYMAPKDWPLEGRDF
ncbi:MAG TPA: hypothetical protein VJ001_01790 [Rhodocyclaceae bacterium]|nr:hypothetical protein [Rhodocyclaceae bacterium]